MRRADTGQEAAVLVNSAPLHDASGAITGAVAVFQDISALRDLEQTQEEFLSSAAHDLTAPLTAIRGHAGLARLELARLPAAAATLRRLDQIEAGTLRMARLIDELVDVTRLQMGAALELNLEPVDLVALVREVVAHQADLSAPQIGVQAELPELWAMVDAERIERVVSNLLSNAVKYSPHGEAIVVRVAGADRAPAPVAVIAVQDQGVGIPPDDLPHIFERFRRAENVVGRVHGTGIGLASVQQIVEQHGGTVQVESALGAGATFTVQLPLGTPATQGSTHTAPMDRGSRRGARREER
jgi:signal transduction histidine kinase